MVATQHRACAPPPSPGSRQIVEDTTRLDSSQGGTGETLKNQCLTLLLSLSLPRWLGRLHSEAVHPAGKSTFHCRATIQRTVALETQQALHEWKINLCSDKPLRFGVLLMTQSIFTSISLLSSHFILLMGLRWQYLSKAFPKKKSKNSLHK